LNKLYQNLTSRTNTCFAFFLITYLAGKRITVRNSQGNVLHKLEVGNIALGSDAERSGNYFYVKYPKNAKPLEITLTSSNTSPQLIEINGGRSAYSPASADENNWEPFYKSINNLELGSTKFDGTNMFIEITKNKYVGTTQLSLKARAWLAQKSLPLFTQPSGSSRELELLL